MTSGLVRILGLIINPLPIMPVQYRKMYFIWAPALAGCFSTVNLSLLHAAASTLLHPTPSLEEQFCAKGVALCSNARIICMLCIILTLVGHLSYSTSPWRSANTATATDNSSTLLCFLCNLMFSLSSCYCSLCHPTFKAGAWEHKLAAAVCTSANLVAYNHKVQ